MDLRAVQVSWQSATRLPGHAVGAYLRFLRPCRVAAVIAEPRRQKADRAKGDYEENEQLHVQGLLPGDLRRRVSRHEGCPQVRLRACGSRLASARQTRCCADATSRRLGPRIGSVDC